MDSLPTTTPRAPSRKVRCEKVRRKQRRVFNALPWLQEPDRPAVRAWAELEVLCELAYEKLRDPSYGLLNAEGEPRALADLYQRLRRAQLQFSRELGMTARARAEISSGSHSIQVEMAASRIARIRKQREGIEDAESKPES